jgi:hypothetical protein
MLVKEFEAGTQAAVAFCIQRGGGTEIGKGANTSLEQMCGNVAFLAESLLRQGVRIYLPGLDDRASHYTPHERINEIYHSLALVEAKGNATLAGDLASAVELIPTGSVIYVLLAVAESDLPAAISLAGHKGVKVVALLYDPFVFQRGRVRYSFESAIDPMYVAQLRNSGAFPMVVPLDVGLSESEDE